MRCNLNGEAPYAIRYFGTKGTIELKNDVLTVTPQDIEPQPEGYSILGWPEKLRNEYLDAWHREHPGTLPGKHTLIQSAETFQAPPDYSYQVDHMNNFMQSVRTRQPSVEDAVYGKNTSIACHMANHSYFDKTIAVWDEGARKIQSV